MPLYTERIFKMAEKTSPISLILASASPRRRELMESLGLPFIVRPSRVDEETEGNLSPDELVKRLALRKAKAVAKEYPDHLVIGSDTVVVLEGQVLGKPKDREEAFRMLSLLSGRTHTVYTGLALVLENKRREESASSATRVRMRGLTEEEMRAYIATGEPDDKAGAYAIQGLGATLVEGIEGDYFTVVGLPVGLLARKLRDFGIDVLKTKRELPR